MVELSTRRRRSRARASARLRSPLSLLVAAAVAVAGAAAMVGTFWLIEVLPFATFLGVVVLYGVLSSSGQPARTAGDETVGRETVRGAGR